jgi:biopolymer transport protein TolQ
MARIRRTAAADHTLRGADRKQRFVPRKRSVEVQRAPQARLTGPEFGASPAPAVARPLTSPESWGHKPNTRMLSSLDCFAGLSGLAGLPFVQATLRALADVAQPGGAAPGADGPPKLDPTQLVLHASLPVKAVLVILVLFSVACWLVIGAKSLHLSRARGESKRFVKAFDQAKDFDELAQGLAAYRGSPFARIFAVGYDEMNRVTRGERGHTLSDAQGTHVEAATRRAAAQEVTHLESWMALLGTIGSTSPFIGLFGTVYGIMDAFLSIGNQQNANLPVVAPKIAEALIATAIGLVAAIPAVMAYNYFARRVGEVADIMEGFAADVAARARLGGI